jgi:hypothetical protein
MAGDVANGTVVLFGGTTGVPHGATWTWGPR